MTNAELMYRVALILRLASKLNIELSEGAWNPHFCADNSNLRALSFCDDLKIWIKNIEERVEKTSIEMGDT